MIKFLHSKKITLKIAIVISLLLISTISLWLYRRHIGFQASEAPRYISNTATAEYEIDGQKYTLVSDPAVVEIIEGIVPPVVVIAHNTTYKSIFPLKGTKITEATKVLINNSTDGIIINGNNWQKNVNLPLRTPQSFSITAQDAYGNNSASVSVTLTRYKTGDINNDNSINLKDLALLMANFGHQTTSVTYKADLNEDNIINSADFTILKSNWNR